MQDLRHELARAYKMRVTTILDAYKEGRNILDQVTHRELLLFIAYALTDERTDILEFLIHEGYAMLALAVAAEFGHASTQYEFVQKTMLGEYLVQMDKVVSEKEIIGKRLQDMQSFDLK